MDTNIAVHDHLHSYVRYWDVSISFTDRIFFVVLRESPFNGKSNVVDYLLINGFNSQKNGIYTRFKNRLGDFISQNDFDGENSYGLREEMINRITEKMPM